MPRLGSLRSSLPRKSGRRSGGGNDDAASRREVAELGVGGSDAGEQQLRDAERDAERREVSAVSPGGRPSRRSSKLRFPRRRDSAPSPDRSRSEQQSETGPARAAQSRTPPRSPNRSELDAAADTPGRPSPGAQRAKGNAVHNLDENAHDQADAQDEEQGQDSAAFQILEALEPSADPDLRMQAYLSLSQLPACISSNEVWLKVSRAICNDLGGVTGSGCRFDVVVCAMKAMESLPLPWKLQLILRQGIEEDLKACLRLEASAVVRQVSVRVFSVLMLKLWLVLGGERSATLLDITADMADSREVSSKDERVHLLQHGKDRVAEVFKTIAMMFNDSSRAVAAETLGALALLVEPGKALFEGGTSGMHEWTDSVFGKKRIDVQLNELRESVFKHLSPRLPLFLDLVQQMWPSLERDMEALFQAPWPMSLPLLRGVPSDRSVPLALGSPFETLAAANVRKVDLHQEQPPQLSLGRDGPGRGAQIFVNDPAEMYDSDEPSSSSPGWESNVELPSPPREERRESEIGMAQLQALGSDLADLNTWNKAAAGALPVVASVLRWLFASRGRRNRPTSITAEVALRESSQWTVEVETEPGSATGGYHKVDMLDLISAWLQNHVLVLLNRSSSQFQIFSLSAHVWQTWELFCEVESPFKLGPCLGKALGAILEVVASSRALSDIDGNPDSALTRFHRDVLLLLREICTAERSSLETMERAKLLSVGIMHCATFDDVRAALTPEDDASTDFLFALWLDLLRLEMSNEAFWKGLSSEDPGLLQELLQHQELEDRRVQVLLCSTLLNALRQWAVEDHWRSKALDRAMAALEVTNSCLTWEHSLEEFNVAEAYLALVSEMGHAMGFLTRQPEVEVVKRWESFLERLVTTNLAHGQHDPGDRIEMLHVVACMPCGLANDGIRVETRAAFVDTLIGEALLELSQFSFQDPEPAFVLLDALTSAAMHMTDCRSRVIGAFQGALREQEGLASLLRDGIKERLSRVEQLGDASFPTRSGLLTTPSTSDKRRKESLVQEFPALVLGSLASSQAMAPEDLSESSLERLNVARLTRGAAKVVSGRWDPLKVTVETFSDSSSGELHFRITMLNRTSHDIPKLSLELSTVGPVAFLEQSQTRVEISHLGPSQRVVHDVSAYALSVHEESKLGSRQRWDDLLSLGDAIQADISNAVRSSIQFARKKGSGKSIKAVIDSANDDGTSSHSGGIGGGIDSKIQKSGGVSLGGSVLSSPAGPSSLVLPTNRQDTQRLGAKRRSSAGFGSLRKPRRNSSRSSSKNIMLHAATAPGASDPESMDRHQDRDDVTGEHRGGTSVFLRPEQSMVWEFTSQKVHAEQASELDLVPRGISFRVTVFGGEVQVMSFPHFVLPLGLLLRPLVTRDVRKEGNRLGGWIIPARFKLVWKDMPHAYFVTSEHSCTSLDEALVLLDLRCMSLTKVAETPYLSFPTTARGAWIARTLGGSHVAFRVTLSSNRLEASGSPRPTQTTASGIWEFRTDSAAIHRAWTTDFSSFFTSLFPASCCRVLQEHPLKRAL